MSLNDPGRRGDNQGPPDLEVIWQDLNKRLSGLFSRRRGLRPVNSGDGGGGKGPGGGFSPGQFGGILGVVLVLTLALWLVSGFYIVDATERGVVLRLGRYTTTTDPGLHWRLPWPVESHEIVDYTSVRTVPIGRSSDDKNDGALMLTDDLNIVSVKFEVQYDVSSAEKFVFQNRLPDEEFVRQIAETAMREIVGKSKMDFVLYEGRAQIAAQAQALVQEILDRYDSGIHVKLVNMNNVQPPTQVQAAFDDATRASQDWERMKNEGEAYANDKIPKAQGEASRLRLDAEAYRARVVAAAEGESARFTQVLAEFKRAPQVTRERMYLDTVQQIFSKASKVMIDNKGGSNMVYLPLDKIVRQYSGDAPAVAPAVQAAPTVLPLLEQANQRDRDLLRDRDRGER
ncbi:MAG: FtsH protease activity modulator HflK [Azoarcus sp.]|jgi:membrane protease subunit HflK|nr:FtsH protease activity modulator HflK [Azoarcus sp.]